VSNSTFFNNTSLSTGTAIRALTTHTNSIKITNNTFFGNKMFSNAPATQDVYLDVYMGNAQFTGNIFAGLNPKVTSLDDGGSTNFESNIVGGNTTGASWATSGNSGGNSIVADAAALFNDAPPAPTENGGPTKTMELSATSAARNFVPFVNGTSPTVDQRGTTRLSADGFIDAGAFELTTASAGSAAVTGGGSGGTPEPTVIDVNPKRITVTDEIVTVFGGGLRGVQDIIVGGTRVPVLSARENYISFRAPKGLSGFQNLELVFAGKSILLERALNFVQADQMVAKVFRGFAANSTKLTRPMKKEIRKFIRANPELTTVVCRGFTSAPATRFDDALAKGRGENVCAYIEKKFPDLTTRVIEGNHTNIPGSNIRRVRVVLR
jgi:hypothetical protein